MSKYQELNDKVSSAKQILVIQADNPDADSLASSLALESLLDTLGKEVYMYCSVDMPAYLKYLQGWDRVESELPKSFDLSIIVDTSAASLLEKINDLPQKSLLEQKPCIVLDHHNDVDCDIPYADIVINDGSKVSTGELIHEIAEQLSWNIPVDAGEFIMTSILADSMGLTTENTSSNTYKTMAKLVDSGVSRPKLEEKRREFNKMPEVIFRYKARLIERTEIIEDNLAMLIIPQQEINEYSPLFNPAPLIQQEHLSTEGIKISIVLKHYDSDRVTAAIRCNYGSPIAAQLAKKFGGGGHEYASGFKIEKAHIDKVKLDCISTVRNLLETN